MDEKDVKIRFDMTSAGADKVVDDLKKIEAEKAKVNETAANAPIDQSGVNIVDNSTAKTSQENIDALTEWQKQRREAAKSVTSGLAGPEFDEFVADEQKVADASAATAKQLKDQERAERALALATREISATDEEAIRAQVRRAAAIKEIQAEEKALIKEEQALASSVSTNSSAMAGAGGGALKFSGGLRSVTMLTGMVDRDLLGLTGTAGRAAQGFERLGYMAGIASAPILAVGVAATAVTLVWSHYKEELKKIEDQAKKAETALNNILKVRAEEAAKKLSDEIVHSREKEDALHQSASQVLDVKRNQEESQREITRLINESRIAELKRLQDIDGLDRSEHINAIKRGEQEDAYQEKLKKTSEALETLKAQQQSWRDEANSKQQLADQDRATIADIQAQKTQVENRNNKPQATIENNNKQSILGDFAQQSLGGESYSLSDLIDRADTRAIQNQHAQASIDKNNQIIAAYDENLKQANQRLTSNLASVSSLTSKADAQESLIITENQKLQDSQNAVNAQIDASKSNEAAASAAEKIKQINSTVNTIGASTDQVGSDIEKLDQETKGKSALSSQQIQEVGHDIQVTKNDLSTGLEAQKSDVAQMQSALAAYQNSTGDQKEENLKKLQELVNDFHATSAEQKQAIQSILDAAKDGIDSQEVRSVAANLAIVSNDITTSFVSANKTIDDIQRMLSQVIDNQIRQAEFQKTLESRLRTVR